MLMLNQCESLKKQFTIKMEKDLKDDINNLDEFESSAESFMALLEEMELTQINNGVQSNNLETTDFMQSLKSAKELLDNPIKWKHLSFGCKSLDNCTNGGLLTRGITEIYGEAGSGKTQILLQLSLMVQLPEDYGGLNKNAVFICIEHHFPSKRLCQLIKIFKTSYPSFGIEFGENILVQEIRYTKALLKCIQKEIPKIIEKRKIGLIVIDSIAPCFSIELKDFKIRATLLRKLANTLLFLIDKYQCVVVCSNQIRFSDNPDDEEGNENEDDESIVPCLGLAWSNLIRTRIQVSKCSIKRKINNENVSRLKRKFKVIFSPDCSENECEFLISSDGVIDAQ